MGVFVLMKLDYTITDPKQRNELVKQILAETPDPSPAYLESLGNYLVLCLEKEEKRQKKIITENRLATINRRETSYEGLVAQLENGEDGLYNLINENNKQTIFKPKITITQQDIETIPYMKQLRESIHFLEDSLKRANGRDAYIIKKTIIDLRKEQYILKDAYTMPVNVSSTRSMRGYIHFDDKTHTFDPDSGRPIVEGFSLMDPKVCSAILCNYSDLKEYSWDKLSEDTYYLMEDFDNISSKALAANDLYAHIVELKIDGKTNVYIQQAIQEEFGIKHSLEYISSLWRNKIPKLIALEAENQFLDYYYLNVKKGKYKRCSCCGEIKLAHNNYFTKNKTAKDGYYSICKKCRNAKARLKKS